MKTKHPPVSDEIPDILREELDRTPPLTQKTLDQLAAANRELEADPAWQADYLKSLFVEKMLQALESRGESKAQVAERLGKTRQYVQKLFDEDKRVNFTLDTLCAVAHALGQRVHLHLCPLNHEPMILSSIKTRTLDGLDDWRRSSEAPAQFAEFVPLKAKRTEVHDVGSNAA